MSLRYALAVVLIAVAGSALIVASGGRLEARAVRGALLGAALAALGAIGGMALVAWSFERRTRQFFGALVLGILARLTLFGGALVYVALLREAEIDVVGVALSLLGFSVVFQVLEVRYVLRGLKAGRS